MQATLSSEIDFWLRETHGWPCACLNKGGCAEAFQCDPCLIRDGVRIASEAVGEGRWEAAHRAVKRAADRDGRLDPLRDALELRAGFETASRHEAVPPYESLTLAVGSGPVAVEESAPARRAQDPNVLYACGLTYAEHKDICADVFRREIELKKVGQQHTEELGVHLQLATHDGCHSTFAWPLPGHRFHGDFDDDPTQTQP